MNLINSILINGSNGVSDIALGYTFAFLRKMVQKIDDVARDGIIIRRFNRKPQSFINIIQLRIAVYNEFVVRYRLYAILFIPVVFIPDLTDDFFKQILNRDKTRSRSVFIQNNGKGDRILSHFD